MKITKSDSDYIEIDFENKTIKGKTTKKNLKEQMELLREVVKNG